MADPSLDPYIGLFLDPSLDPRAHSNVTTNKMATPKLDLSLDSKTLGPKAHHLWQSFLDHCKKINEMRHGEDMAGFETRKAELAFLATVDTDQGREAWQRAMAEDARLRDMNSRRNKEDGTFLRELFVYAVKLDPKSETQPAKKMKAGKRKARELDEDSENEVEALQAKPGYVFKPEVKYDVATGRHRTSLYQAPSVFAPSQGRVTIQPTVSSGMLHVARPRSLTMAEIKNTDILVPYPVNPKTNFYIMECTLCGRSFTSAHGLYGHLAQSDEAHLALFGGEKNFKKAVALCGIRVVDANKDSVEAHNIPATKQMMGTPGKMGI